jgi:endonuclease YncB( thermonuclease family)
MCWYAQPCRHYSNRYVADEEAAKKAKLGLWAGESLEKQQGSASVIA